MKKDELSGLVYQVPCADCNLIYIDRTKLSFKSRLTEHQRLIKYQKLDQSALCEHSMIMDHKIDWENTIILNVETDYDKRLFVESWFRNSKSNVIIRNDGNFFP